MADKIVPIVDIDISTIFYQLHIEAQKRAQEECPAIDVINFGVDIQNKTFIGAGDFIVLAQHNEKDTSKSPKDKPNDFKAECKKALVSYLTVFIGKDIADKLDDDMLARVDTPAQPSESAIANLPLSRLLMEDGETKQSGIGYYVEYSVAIEGQKKYKWHDLRDKFEKYLAKSVFSALKTAGSSIAKSLFGNIWKDIESFKINIGGKPVNLGASAANALSKVAKGISDTVTIAGQKFKKVFGKTDIRELDQNFYKEIHNKFTNTTANPTVYPTDTVMTMLSKAHRLDAEVRNKLMNNGKIFRMEYVIVLQVDQQDENYPMYSIKTLHPLFVRAIKETKGMSAFKDIPTSQFFSEDDIIKIDDFENALGVSKLRKPSSPIESLETKCSFLKIMLENCINEEATTSSNDNMKKQILQMLKDPEDPHKDFSEYKLQRLARKISAKDDDEYAALLKTDKMPTKTDLVNAIKDIRSVDAMEDIIQAFIDAGNLEELFDEVKHLFGKDADNGNESTNSNGKGDMYIFCLTNVIRKTDEEKEADNKATTAKKD